MLRNSLANEAGLTTPRRSDGRRPRVLFCLPDSEGLGVQRLVLELQKCWDHERLELAITVHHRGGALDGLLSERTRVFALDATLPGRLPKVRVLFRPLLHRAMLKAYCPDVVISFVPGDNLSLLLLKRTQGGRGPKLVVSENIHVTSQVPDYAQPFRAVYTTLFPKLYPEADRVICVAEESKRDLVDQWQVPEALIRVIPNPVAVQEAQEKARERPTHAWFARARAAPVILGAGRLEKQKRFDRLIQAVAALPARHEPTLAIMGSGPLHGQLLACARAHGLQDRFVLLGFQKNPWSLMAAADLFVLSSDYEGFPLVLVEAMAVGAPIVSTPCPSGPRELLEQGALGRLSRDCSVDSLSAAICEALDKPAAGRAMAAKALGQLQRYSATVVTESYMALCEELVNERPAAART